MKQLIELAARIRHAQSEPIAISPGAADAIEALVEENAALSAELSEGTKCYADLIGRFESLTAERDALQQVTDQHAETILWQAGRISELTDERDSAVQAAKYSEHIDATPENQRETMLYDALKERDALRAEIAKMREPWVSVSERLPKTYEEVMVWPHPSHNSMTAEVNTIGTWQYGEYESGFGWVGSVCYPTHWMPLPAAPGAQPEQTKNCKTCKHFKQGANPLVGVYDIDCFECRHYYASRWEAQP